MVRPLPLALRLTYSVNKQRSATLGKYIAAFSFLAPMIGFIIYNAKENNLILQYDPKARRVPGPGLAMYIASDRLYRNPEFMREYNRLSYIKWGCFLSWVIALFILARYRYYFG